MWIKTIQLKTLTTASLLSLLPFTTMAADTPNGPHVATSGIGSVDVIPDMATLTISVTAQAKETSTAKDQADQGVAKYYEFLTNYGIDKKDVNSANIQIYPEYDYSSKISSNSAGKLKGYRAIRSVQVSLRDLNKLNALLDGALKAGLTDISSIELGSSQAEVHQLEARKKAMVDATSRAKELAEGFNAKLGPIYSINYRVVNVQPVMRNYAAVGKMSNEAVGQTYQQSNITFSDNVDVVFDIQR